MIYVIMHLKVLPRKNSKRTHIPAVVKKYTVVCVTYNNVAGSGEGCSRQIEKMKCLLLFLFQFGKCFEKLHFQYSFISKLFFSIFAIPFFCVLLSCAKEDISGEKVHIKKYLSEYNLFQKAGVNKGISKNGTLIPKKENIPYFLNSVLFSDYALKFRTMHIPANKSVYYRKKSKHINKEVFAFPVGSIITKTFSFPDDFRKVNPSIDIIETRILIRQPKGWVAIPYVWNKARTDAIRKVGGKVVPISFINKKGKNVNLNYIVPSKNDCLSCHHYQNSKKEQVMIPIGLKARHLNRDYYYKDIGNKNQLEFLSSLGKLKKLSKNLPKMANYDDVSSPINERARAYLDINCGHCHNIRGTVGITTQFSIDYHAFPNKIGRCQTSESVDTNRRSIRYDTTSGDYRVSALWYRMNITSSGLMPQIGRTLRHDEGIAIIKEWMDYIKSDNCKT